MDFYFEYLTTRSGKAVLLVFNTDKYLFNCFEGFQRYLIESLVRPSQITMAFLPNDKALVPFIGTYLSMAGAGKMHVNVFYQNKLLHSSLKKFAKRPNLKTTFHTEFYEDHKIKVESINNDECSNLILKILPGRGKFHRDKAIALGIPNSFWTRLCDKELIEHNGEEYLGDDFLEDDIVPEKIAIIFNKNSFEGLEEKFVGKDIKYFICFDENTAIYLKKYFTDQIFYVLKDSEGVEFRSLQYFQSKFNKIDDSYNFAKGTEIREYKMEEENNILHLKSCDKIIFQKKTNTYLLKKRGDRKLIITPEEKEKSECGILFLGTGSAVPSRYRNVTSILIEDTEACVLLDCGEDTLFNIHRVYGNYDILKRVDLIFISHSHADHHLGLVSVLEKILEYKDDIKIILPKNVKSFCEKFHNEKIQYFCTEIFEKPILINDLYENTITKYTHNYDFGYKVTICPVMHCNDSCAVAIQFKNKTISFSGDCRPSNLFAYISKNADVMIHEATFEADLNKNAVKTKHSTSDEAIEIFKKSGAKTLILTHFSQRYPKAFECERVICAYDFFRYDYTNRSLESSKEISEFFKLENSKEEKPLPCLNE